MSLENLNINENLIKSLQEMGIENPTEVQEKTIPLFFQKQDMIIQSPTGSGKTFSYLLPILSQIQESDRGVFAIILVPVHELAFQIKKEIEKLTKYYPYQLIAEVLIGEASIQRQVEKLKKKPPIIIGTPGRILDLIEKRKLKPHTVKTIIIDEGDRLFDERNNEKVRQIIKSTLKERQLVSYSATLPNKIVIEMQKTMDNPNLILIEKQNTNLIHLYVETELRKKYLIMKKLLKNKNQFKGIIFINNIQILENIYLKMNYDQMEVEKFYGKKHKEERKTALNHLKTGKIKFLIASDIAARGIHIDGVNIVVNYEINTDLDFYKNRAGRAGRNNQKGIILSIGTKNEILELKKTAKKLNINLTKTDPISFHQLYLSSIKEK